MKLVLRSYESALVIVLALTPLCAGGEFVTDVDPQAASAETWETGHCDRLDSLTLFGGIDGSKQPQDFGVNANLGGRARILYAAPLWDARGVGFQIGTALAASANAVRVPELIGEETDRLQSFTSVGVFKRSDGGATFGFTYDLLYQESFDRFTLSQLRLRGGIPVGDCDEVGVTARIPLTQDDGLYGSIPVTLDPIAQGTAYWRRFWTTGTQTTFWAGVAEGHGEDNAVTGPSRPQDDVFVFGADILAPLNDYLAIYGETNLMMPADTGTVDAFLGVEWYPYGRTCQSRRGRYSPVLPVAANTSFSVDLSRR